MDREAWWVQSMGSQRVGHNWITNTHTHTQGVHTILNLRFGITVSFTLSSDPSRRLGLWLSWWVEVKDPPCETQALGWVAKRRLEIQERTNGVVLPTGLFRWVWCTLSSVSSVQSLSRVQLSATPMDCSTPGLPVHHQLPELTQTHVHWVGDTIQPSRPL